MFDIVDAYIVHWANGSMCNDPALRVNIYPGCKRRPLRGWKFNSRPHRYCASEHTNDSTLKPTSSAKDCPKNIVPYFDKCDVLKQCARLNTELSTFHTPSISQLFMSEPPKHYRHISFSMFEVDVSQHISPPKFCAHFFSPNPSNTHSVIFE
jgi:hypothetical protein